MDGRRAGGWRLRTRAEAYRRPGTQNTPLGAQVRSCSPDACSGLFFCACAGEWWPGGRSLSLPARPPRARRAVTGAPHSYQTQSPDSAAAIPLLLLDRASAFETSEAGRGRRVPRSSPARHVPRLIAFVFVSDAFHARYVITGVNGVPRRAPRRPTRKLGGGPTTRRAPLPQPRSKPHLYHSL